MCRLLELPSPAFGEGEDEDAPTRRVSRHLVRIADQDRLILRGYGLLCAEEALADLLHAAVGGCAHEYTPSASRGTQREQAHVGELD